MFPPARTPPSALLLLLLVEGTATAATAAAPAGATAYVPGPPPPPWRNDTANMAITAALNAYLAETSFTSTYDGAVTDAQPLKLAWDVAGDMPHALKDGVACWMPPDAAFPEGEVVIAGGLWPSGVAHEPSVHVNRNRSYSYDVARNAWRPLSLPPYVPGRTQGACLTASRSLVLISGGDGGDIGPRVLRLSRPAGAGDWVWDTDLPPLPTNATRFTSAAHSVGGRWLVVGLGAPDGAEASEASAMASYRLDLQHGQGGGNARWEATPLYPGTANGAHPVWVPISAAVGDKWLVFGGEHRFAPGSAAAAAWASLPDDIATMATFGPKPSLTVIDARDAYAYDPAADTWEALPKMPFGMIQGPKHAPVIAGRYVLLLGAQRRLTVRRGAEPPGYMAAVHRPPLEGAVEYYGDDALYYDTVEKVYGSLGKVPYGVVTASWVDNGTHVLGFGGEPTHGWNGNTESAIQRAAVMLRA